MIENQENILVEFDYNNITIIDPNKVIDENGKAKERFVKQENLVMYANLECKVLPRTKLAIGVASNDQVQTISVASMNFLSPGGKEYLENTYTDEITGKDSLQGQGVNQPNQKSIKNPNRTDDYYIRQTINSGGKPGATDNGLLGITQIRVSVNTAFNPSIEIELEDVKGRALFEAGDSSPYAAFFNMPYPLFQLTLKGYYGKAIRLPLMLRDFQTRYDGGTGNFKISLKFYTYKFTALAEVSMGYLTATPHMYKSRLAIQQTSGGPSTTTKVEENIVEIGYQKIKELYSEYKSKGMIPDDFPEITVVQMQKRLDSFIKNVLDNFAKENLTPLSDCETYARALEDYQKKIYYGKGTSWFQTNCDLTNYYVLKTNKVKFYTFKPEILNDKKDSLNKQKKSISDLKSIVDDFNKIFLENPTFGKDGKYKIGKVEKNSPIPITVKDENAFILQPFPSEDDIDWNETYKQLKGNNTPSTQDIDDLKKKFRETGILLEALDKSGKAINGNGTQKNPKYLFFFEGKYKDSQPSFIDQTNNMGVQLKTFREQIESALTDALQQLLEQPNNGVGFVPNIRNVLAVIFANGEAFLRLMEDVHKKAWDINFQDENSLKIRRETILPSNTSNACSDNTDSGVDEKIPIYPWPQFIVETIGEKGQEKYEIEYPGNPKYINQTKGFLYDAWPEIEFVEEFLRGYTERMLPPSDTSAYFNEVTDVQRISYDAIEFPTTNAIFENKEQVKYFYEIYERLILYCYYSKLSRVNTTSSKSSIINLLSDAEKSNIVKSLGTDNPLLTQKLKQYGFDGNNFLTVLKHFSNDGTGESWQNFIRGIFNTSYIKNYVQNSSFEFLSPAIINSTLSVPLISLDSEKSLVELLTTQKSPNDFDLTDIYPFVDINWCKNNLANGVAFTNVFETSKVLCFNDVNKSIGNFNKDTKSTEKKPLTSFNYKTMEEVDTNFDTVLKLKNFYSDRMDGYKQFPTEGNLNYSNYSGNVSTNQTVSILNTPYFINSISDGVQKFLNNDEYPFVSAAYLFINSLPLATLKERYKNYNQTSTTNQSTSKDLDYIFATLKKFGAIHKVPYSWILKIGSVYHRYKKYVEENVDILDSSWSGFSYIDSYDPNTNSPTKVYPLTIKGANIDLVLEKNTPVGTEISTLINLGFYPKLLNDFNLFYQGYYVINPYLSMSGTGYVTGKILTVTNISSNNLQSGLVINGDKFDSGTEIVGQITGVPGGLGTYEVNIEKNVAQSNFKITNNFVQGYTIADIQTALNSGLEMNYSQKSIIDSAEGFDPNIPLRDLRIIPWSIFVKTFDNNSSYVMPSCGYLINQTKYECFNVSTTGITMTQEVTGNTSMYNGSVRLFWNAPNYGYFDTTRVTKPTPFEYMKKIFSGVSEQENFSINSNEYKNTEISEIFSVFEKDVLDKFESMFLDFSKSIYNYDSAILSGETTITETSFMNFQMLFRSMMNIPIQSGKTGDEIIKNVITAQIGNLKTKLTSFMEYDVYFKYGNPSNFNRRTFQTFSTPQIEDPYTWDNYTVTTPNSLPPAVSLSVSKSTYPDSWKSLQTYVGFSELDKLKYSDSGSYITDFFIDNNIAFDSTNIKNLAPIIKIYATQKYLGKINSPTDLSTLITNYMSDINQFQTDITNNLFIKIQKDLPNVNNIPESRNDSVLNGDQNKVELWETFKALNDRWIAGTDFKTKTLFEDVLLMDRASRNIGDKILVDVFKLRNRLLNIPEKASMLSFIQTIIQENNFVIMNIPAYMNFYGVQDAVKNPVPKAEGTLDFANSLFGTHMNVDYRDSTSKMVCFYAGKPSEHLDVKNVDYRFRSDAFDLRRASDNPLIENLVDKNDWDKSNKVVGFNVDIGTQNQSIFHGFFVDQRAGTPTAEGLEILNQMANQGGNRGASTQSVSLYNLYKNRSYNCTVSMLGNAMIQPTMYFNLRYVPMFSGPYMILSVNHVVTPGSFETTFTGVRQPIHGLPKVDSYLQSLKTNLLQSIITLNNQEKDATNQKTTENQDNIIAQTNTALTNLNNSRVNTSSNSQTCTASTHYTSAGFVATKPNTTSTSLSFQLAKSKIISKTKNTVLQKLIFTKFYLTCSPTNNSTVFTTNENNYAAIYLDVDAKGKPMNWGSSDSYFQKKYYCSKEQVPYVFFNSADDCIQFLISRWDGPKTNFNLDFESATKFLLLNQTSVTADDNVYTKANATQLSDVRFNVQVALALWDKIP